MKYCSQLSVWIFVVAFTLFGAHISLIQADPTDDFSFTLGHSSDALVYTVMSEQRVTAILADRLDLFPVSQVPRLAHHLMTLCKYYRFDPAFVLSLVQVESRFRVKARSPVGALGLMQLMPGTAARVATELHLDPITERALLDPFMNLKLGIAYLAILRDHYRGLPPYYLVAAYNVGPARLDELIVRKNFRPRQTAKYFQDIRHGVTLISHYHRATKAEGL